MGRVNHGLPAIGAELPAAIARTLGLPETCSTEQALLAIIDLAGGQVPEGVEKLPYFAAVLERLAEALTAGTRDSENAKKMLQEFDEIHRDTSEQVQALEGQIKADTTQLRVLAAYCKA